MLKSKSLVGGSRSSEDNEEESESDRRERIEKLRRFFIVMTELGRKKIISEDDFLSCPHTDFLEGAD